MIHEYADERANKYGELREDDVAGVGYVAGYLHAELDRAIYGNDFISSADFQDHLEWLEDRISALLFSSDQGTTFDEYPNFQQASFSRLGEPRSGTTNGALGGDDVRVAYPDDTSLEANRHYDTRTGIPFGNRISSNTDIHDLGWMDNEISFIKLYPDQGATFYQYPNFEGASFSKVAPQDGWLRVPLASYGGVQDWWNDRISSIDLWGAGAPSDRSSSNKERSQQDYLGQRASGTTNGELGGDDVGVVQTGYVRGWRHYDTRQGSPFDNAVWSDTDIRDLGWMDNEISCIELGPGQGATFYQYPNFEGASFFRQAPADANLIVPLAYDGGVQDWWNDRISSIDLWGA